MCIRESDLKRENNDETELRWETYLCYCDCVVTLHGLIIEPLVAAAVDL